MSNSKTFVGSALAVAILLMAGCATQPQKIAELEQARRAVTTTERDPVAQQVASIQLEDAKLALAQADAAWESQEDPAQIKHYAYLAQRNAQIADERAAEARTREQIEESSARRNQVLLTARTAEAQELSQELAELKAKKTDRGMVLTLGDVLFNTDKAQLKPGAQSTVDRLAVFMRENPQRQILIEGHTDSRGSDEYNQVLSRDRAEAVEAALLRQNIASNRMQIRGLGERFPVASNNTAAGQQQNRRVEIVISNADGGFPVAARR